MLFKPNITLNIIFPSFWQVGQDSLLSSKEFAVKASRKKLELRKNDKFRNYVGYTLSQVAIADHHDEFISRVFQLDAKIHLFNKILNKGALPQTLSHINNPFYDDKTAYYSDDTKAICIDAPMQRKRKADHCLRVK